ncbi:putative potassium voltage-gated channel [Trypanosoma vivax]|uniref:Potassium voltage-gated channel, putative n=1 Tax=Trypanosoma vivax (strain Y486) TaxID=1055687 RepID=F9WQY6_TRYVY|nr:putative potassium voltage-gated channel [Trypanosoma vivax]CCD19968.1 potassium voltage-gated channel, putative [Trypanosoma vivax Y486]|eukprot:CCD19968.1 potassium voltage-gated channel, putative [Trypanosoma vivax Y486]
MRYANQVLSKRAIVNAGGRRFETWLSTLHRYPETSFARMFPAPKHVQRSREFFVDVTPQVFECVLGFLRTGRLSLPTSNEQLRAEIVYSLDIWGLMEHAFPSALVSSSEAEGGGSDEGLTVLPDICVVQACDHMQHDQGVKRHALTITYGADGFQLRGLTQRIRRDLQKQLSSTYWQCYQTNERAAFFVTTKVANGTADLLTTSVTQQIVEHTEAMGYTLASSYVTLSPDVVHTSVRMFIHNFIFRRARLPVLELSDAAEADDGVDAVEAQPNITPPPVGPRRIVDDNAPLVPSKEMAAADIWTAR